MAEGDRGQADRPAGGAADRSQPGRYFAIVFFDSYESAMENSSLPETQAAAEKYGVATGSRSSTTWTS